jgi:predicted lipoprotein with Yx(FWY)xxD motif
MTSTARRTRVVAHLAALSGAAAIALVPALSISQQTAQAAPPAFLHAANIPNYAGILENSASRTLYALSTEKGTKLHCAGTCTATWRPLLVKSTTKSVTVGAGVKGAVGFVRRSPTTKQVTFNSYPVYTYAGDSAANQSHGEARVADGGTWHMLHASAKTPAATPVAPLLQAANIPAWPGVLENRSSFSLYVLSVEKGGSIHCTGTCPTIWRPLLVTRSTTSIAVGAGVKGHVGFVTRGSMRQVTYNSYPVYTYTGDTGPNQYSGEGTPADGGTWTLVHASATTSGGTPDVTGLGR